MRSHEFLSPTSLQSIANYTLQCRGFNIFDINYLKNRDIIWSHTDRVLELFPALQNSSDSFILITGAADMPVNAQLFSLKPKCIKKWFATNVDYKHEDLIPLPLGVANNKAPFRDTITDFQSLGELSSFSHPISNKIINKVYTCFGIEQFPAHRSMVKDILIKNNMTQFNNLNCSINTHIPWKQYATDLKDYLFLASPKGNGIQCHKTWEALLLGCIPIVDTHFSYDYNSKNLPIIQIDDWNKITPDFLKPWAIAYKEGKLFNNLQELTLEYWINKILSAQDAL